jgi:hypothetical protein
MGASAKEVVMSLSPEPRLSTAPGGATPEPDVGEVIAAALVRVATLVPPGALVPRGWSGPRFGMAPQTVSEVGWLSGGRARGAA